MIGAMLGDIDFDKCGGLVPVVVQDCATLQVLMLAYMNEDALAETQRSGEAVFYSRSRAALWRKGETSGARLRVVAIEADCDRDTLLLAVEPAGPACHRGTTSCFSETCAPGVGRFGALERTIAARRDAPEDAGYTAALFATGPKRIAQKVGEEAVEAALAGAAGDDKELCAESADLIYHLIVLLAARGLKLGDVAEELAARAGDNRA